MVEFKRKLYPRGSSYETTIPKPMLFKLDMDKKHHVVFKYDKEKDRWYIEFEEIKDEKK
ncbi:hypothetical protein GF327_03900 [Candidatus Woesearchaeota archaeon]|nr:hypothetical protein [Candidatus Woesearchaeota archaeon]